MRPLLRRGIRAALYWSISTLGWAQHLTRAGDGRPVGEPRRILVIRLDLLGDVLFSTAAVRALRLRYPGAYIAMLTLPYTAPLARLCPDLDEVIALDTNRIRRIRGLFDPRTWLEYARSLRLIQSRNFDLAISLSGRTASLCAFLSGSPWTIGYSGEAYPFLLTHPVEGGRYLDRVHEVVYGLRLAEAAGATARPEHLQVRVEDHAHRRVRAMLGKLEDRGDDPLVVVHAGSLNGSAKRWPPSYWASFITALRQRTGARIVLAGAGSDVEIAREVAAHGAEFLNLVGETTVEELVALLDEADLVATGDSGPLHLAVALGVPLLAVYGPTDPAIHGPYHPVGPVILHRQDLACSPCYSMAATAECPLGDPICMRLVEVQTMVASALRLLDARRSGVARGQHIGEVDQPGAKTSF